MTNVPLGASERLAALLAEYIGAIADEPLSQIKTMSTRDFAAWLLAHGVSVGPEGKVPDKGGEPRSSRKAGPPLDETQSTATAESAAGPKGVSVGVTNIEAIQRLRAFIRGERPDETSYCPRPELVEQWAAEIAPRIDSYVRASLSAGASGTETPSGPWEVSEMKGAYGYWKVRNPNASSYGFPTKEQAIAVCDALNRVARRASGKEQE